eukprot:TRINITY_DN12510_c0_g1_i1.p1 TRINITY_DN12510_c0_g1~~TRINITY_DN12510_c0_g1_i1.p1  ORF type:complete len:433 (+),score=97.26 TRINITY_DN12510_c0_g1_i1:3-1301(+)
MSYRGKRKRTSGGDRNPKRRREEPQDFFAMVSSSAESSSSEELDPYANETPDERRLRLAQFYVSRLQNLESDEEEDEEETDRVGQMLQMEAFAQRTGRSFKFKEVSEYLRNIQIEEENIIVKRGHSKPVTAICISKDEKYVYSVSKDCTIIKWDLVTGERKHTIKGGRKGNGGHTKEIWTIDITSDGTLLATGGKDNRILLWNTSDHSLRETFEGHRDSVTALKFRKNTKDLYSGSADRTVKLWDCNQFAYIETLYGHQSPIFDLDTLKNEKLITCANDKTARVFKIVRGTQLVFRCSVSNIECVSYLTEKNWVTGCKNGYIFLWKIQKKTPVACVPEAHSGWISAIASLPYTDVFATGSNDGFIRLWKIDPGFGGFELLREIPMEGWVNGIKFSESGKYLVVGIGQEHKRGRWEINKSAKNGIRIITLGDY